MSRTSVSLSSDQTLGASVAWAATHTSNPATLCRPRGRTEGWTYAEPRPEADGVSRWLQDRWAQISENCVETA
jgi:hypothetical protein